MIIFMMSGLISAFAGILIAARLGAVRSSTAMGFELDIITVVLLGGVSIFGGVGTMFGVLAFGLSRSEHSQWSRDRRRDRQHSNGDYRSAAYPVGSVAEHVGSVSGADGGGVGRILACRRLRPDRRTATSRSRVPFPLPETREWRQATNDDDVSNSSRRTNESEIMVECSFAAFVTLLAGMSSAGHRTGATRRLTRSWRNRGRKSR